MPDVSVGDITATSLENSRGKVPASFLVVNGSLALATPEVPYRIALSLFLDVKVDSENLIGIFLFYPTISRLEFQFSRFYW
jgi:hypothetical protein